jgi:Protein of unknown function (DUF2971)
MPAKDHPTFKKPADLKVKVWRYMSLAKFVWLLQRSALFFSRSDLMGDPFEGHYSKVTAASEEAFVAAQMTDPLFASWGEEVHRRNFRKILYDVPQERVNLFVNCWHMNDYESLAMWKLYAGQHDSICIQSTFRKLQRALPAQAFLGTVKYIDYNKEYISVTDAFQYIVHKRTGFEHEKELRAVIWRIMNEDRFEMIGDSGMAGGEARGRSILSTCSKNRVIEPVTSPYSPAIARFGLVGCVHTGKSPQR